MEVTAHLRGLGWNSFFESHFEEFKQTGLMPARVVEELQGFLSGKSADAEYLAEISGKLQHQAVGREDFPAVGGLGRDHRTRRKKGGRRIEHILPRRTKLARKVAGREMSEQIVATNLDMVFVVSALNREFNLRRIERYLTIVWDSGARPVVLLNKADLCPDADGARIRSGKHRPGNSGALAECDGEDGSRCCASVSGAGNHGCVCGLVRRREVHHH